MNQNLYYHFFFFLVSKAKEKKQEPAPSHHKSGSYTTPCVGWEQKHKNRSRKRRFSIVDLADRGPCNHTCKALLNCWFAFFMKGVHEETRRKYPYIVRMVFIYYAVGMPGPWRYHVSIYSLAKC